MRGTNFPEANGFLGRPSDMEDEDCYALPVCRGIWRAPSGEQFPVVISCWELTDEERESIAAGGKIYLHLVGLSMQPAMLSTKIEAQTLSSRN